MNNGTSLTPSRLAHRIKAWAEKMYITFSNSAWRENFRFILKSDVEGRRVGLSMLDNAFNGWSINHAENGLKCVKVEENEETKEVISLGADSIAFSVPMKGVDGESKECLATQQYVDSHSGASPHLYAHIVHCLAGTTSNGDVSFVIYNQTPEEKYTTLQAIISFLCDNNFNSVNTFYPANGVTTANIPIKGIFANPTPLITYGGKAYEVMTRYGTVITDTVLQIF